MKADFFSGLSQQLEALKKKGLYKKERVIISQQQVDIVVNTGETVINCCSNNYLGLANSKELIAESKNALDKYGYGLASVRFICGTQDIHKELENRISKFLKMQDTILYSSCFDANSGFFASLLKPVDAIFSDSLNHASIIDGIRLCKARRFQYANNDMADLEKKLKAAGKSGTRYKLIATDGVFSMEGVIANLAGVCDLADKYDAMVMVDDSHAVGCIGEHGRGTHEHCGVMDRIDILTGTLGKALGGASGGYISAKNSAVIDWLRNNSRPYLFSNTLSPTIASASIKVLDMLESSDKLRRKLSENSTYFRLEMDKLGFHLKGNGHAIIPVMLGDTLLASEFAKRMLKESIYVVSFSFPVVPKGTARIRTQMSAAHNQKHIDLVITAFAKVGRELGVIA